LVNSLAEGLGELVDQGVNGFPVVRAAHSGHHPSALSLVSGAAVATWPPSSSIPARSALARTPWVSLPSLVCSAAVAVGSAAARCSAAAARSSGHMVLRPGTGS